MDKEFEVKCKAWLPGLKKTKQELVADTTGKMTIPSEMKSDDLVISKKKDAKDKIEK